MLHQAQPQPAAQSPQLSDAPENDSQLSGDAQLADFLMQFALLPYDFVLACYPWGEPGTALEKWPEGPDEWQTEGLMKLQNALVAQQSVEEAVRTAIQFAAKAGHGVGKTAFIAWIIHWFMSTRNDPQVVVTAGTATQLESKTWREIAVWKDLALNGHWFEWTATTYYLKERPETWKARAIPWSESRPDAFAGTHAKHVLIIFDEGSAIADVIYETVSGALTTPGAIMIVMGNPTQNGGMFHRIFHALAHRWIRMTVDSRRARMVNNAQVQQWLEDYGEDSDYFRVRVRGEFPRAGSTQFIDSDTIAKCFSYQSLDHERHAVILTVDVARFGDDSSVVTARQGRKRLEKNRYQKMDLVSLADKVADTHNYYTGEGFRVHLVVDGDGIGGGLVDILRARGYDVVDVNSGAQADDPETYYNKKAEMFGRMKKAMQEGLELTLPNGEKDKHIEEQAMALMYGFSNKNQIQMEKKADMKKRLGYSPDDLDSLALGYAVIFNDAELVAGTSPHGFRKAGGGLSTTNNWRKQGLHGRSIRGR